MNKPTSRQWADTCMNESKLVYSYFCKYLIGSIATARWEMNDVTTPGAIFGLVPKSRIGKNRRGQLVSMLYKFAKD
jgi:hypothetical protein